LRTTKSEIFEWETEIFGEFVFCSVKVLVSAEPDVAPMRIRPWILPVPGDDALLEGFSAGVVINKILTPNASKNKIVNPFDDWEDAAAGGQAKSGAQVQN
jgi:hypothetical protein